MDTAYADGVSYEEYWSLINLLTYLASYLLTYDHAPTMRYVIFCNKFVTCRACEIVAAFLLVHCTCNHHFTPRMKAHYHHVVLSSCSHYGHLEMMTDAW